MDMLWELEKINKICKELGLSKENNYTLNCKEGNYILMFKNRKIATYKDHEKEKVEERIRQLKNHYSFMEGKSKRNPVKKKRRKK